MNKELFKMKFFKHYLHQIQFPMKNSIEQLLKSPQKDSSVILKKFENYIKEELDIKSKRNSAFLLGYIYFKGINIERSKEKGVSFLKESDFRESYIIIAIYHWERKEYKEANEYFIKISKFDLKKVAHYLAEIYFHGYVNGIVDFEKSKMYAQMSTDKSSSLFYLAKIHLNKLTDDSDIKTGIQHLEDAVNAGHLESKTFLGICYITGSYGIKLNEEKGIDIMLEKGENGIENFYSFYPLGQYYESKKNYEKAIEFYKKDFELGSTNSAEDLGHMYYKGIGVEQNFDKALEYLEGIKVDTANICYLRYKIYIKGTNEQKSKSFNELQKAANMGHPTASKILGHMYLSGNSKLGEDYKKAEELLIKSAQNNDPQAILSLANMYLQNPKKKLETEILYKKSLDLGENYAKVKLGIFYFRERRYREAKAFLGTCDQKYANKIAGYLGEIYYKGLGVKKDYKTAIRFFKIGLHHKDPRSVSRLCEIYREGYGVEPDDMKSIELNELSKKLLMKEG